MSKLILCSLIAMITISCSPKIYTLTPEANEYGVSVDRAYTQTEYPGEQSGEIKNYLHIYLKNDGNQSIQYHTLYYNQKEYNIESDHFPKTINLKSGTPSESYQGSPAEASIVCTIDGSKVILHIPNISNQEPTYMP